MRAQALGADLGSSSSPLLSSCEAYVTWHLSSLLGDLRQVISASVPSSVNRISDLIRVLGM